MTKKHKDYIIAVPIDPDREWTLDMLKRGIERQDHLPNKVGIVTSRDVFEKHFAHSGLYELAETPRENRTAEKRYRVPNIAYNRERLREWFIEKRDEELILWLDSDIELVYPHATKEMIEKIEKHDAQRLHIPYQNRPHKDYPSHGTGCVMIRREVTNMARFYRGEFIKDGEIKHTISEDYMYFATLQAIYNRDHQFEWIAEREKCKHALDFGDIKVVHHLDVYDREDRDYIDHLDRQLKKEGRK